MGENSVVDDGVAIKRKWGSGNEVKIAFEAGAIVFTINGEVVHTEEASRFIKDNVCPSDEYPPRNTLPETFIRALGADSNRPDKIGAESHNDVYEYENGLFTWVGSDDEAQFRTDWSFTTITDILYREDEYETLTEVWENKVA